MSSSVPNGHTNGHTNGSTGGQHIAANNWTSPGSAAYDFRSDVVTSPTLSMLSAIQATSLLDDVFLEDPTTTELESFVASLTSFPAAILVLSGTMGNQLALRTHLGGPPHSVLTDHRSHIMVWEAGGVANLSGALVLAVAPANGHHLTLEDVQKHAVLGEVGDEVHSCPTRVISLENTLNGTLLPLDECRRIGAWARENNIATHLDGARLWEAASALAEQGQCGGSPTEVLRAYCGCFDSVSLCFSKGLGAPIGSVVIGGEKFVRRARHIRKSIGGGLRQAGVVAAPARVAVEETFLGGKLAASHRRARQVADMWTGLGGELAEPTETNMVWLGGLEKDEFVKICAEEGVRTMGGRLVVHYQINEDAVERLRRAMVRILKKGDADKVDGGEARKTKEQLEINVE